MGRKGRKPQKTLPTRASAAEEEGLAKGIRRRTEKRNLGVDRQTGLCFLSTVPRCLWSAVHVGEKGSIRFV